MGSRADPRQKIVGEQEFEAKTEAVWRGYLQPGMLLCFRQNEDMSAHRINSQSFHHNPK